MLRVVYTPDRDIIGLVIRAASSHDMVVLLQNLENRGIKVMRASVYRDKRVHAFLVVDVTGKEGYEPDELLREVKSSGAKVKVVRVIPPLARGYLVDKEYFPFHLGPFRAVILPFPLYKAMIKDLQEKFGGSVGAFLYHSGYAMGKRAIKSHRKIFKAGVDERRLAEMHLLLLFLTSGMGKPEITYLSPARRRAKVRMEGNFECELFVGSGKPSSNFVRGLLAGVFAGIFGADVKAVETKCIAAGDKYCEFEIEPA